MVMRSRGLEELSVETTLVSRRQQLQRVLVHPQDPRDFCDRRHLVPHVETEIRQEEGERSRERRREPSEPPTMPTSWGARTLSAEVRINELARKFQVFSETMQAGQATLTQRLTSLEGRISQLENNIPERLHRTEERQELNIQMFNELTRHFNDRMFEIEQKIAAVNSPSHGQGNLPQFGQTNAAPQVQQFNIGSPLTPNSQSVPKAPNQSPPDPWSQFTGSRSSQSNPGFPTSGHVSSPAPRSNHGATLFDPRDWNITGMKVSKSLVPFNGSSETYQTWANRMKDHFCEKNPNWSHVFKLIESWKIPISNSQLGTNVIGDTHNPIIVDFNWVANHLWTFIGKQITDTMYYSRTTLTNGEDGNGVELWRALYIQNEGGADQAEVGGMNDFHTFPQCTNVANLQT